MRHYCCAYYDCAMLHGTHSWQNRLLTLRQRRPAQMATIMTMLLMMIHLRLAMRTNSACISISGAIPRFRQRIRNTRTCGLCTNTEPTLCGRTINYVVALVGNPNLSRTERAPARICGCISLIRIRKVCTIADLCATITQPQRTSQRSHKTHSHLVHRRFAFVCMSRPERVFVHIFYDNHAANGRAHTVRLSQFVASSGAAFAVGHPHL